MEPNIDQQDVIETPAPEAETVEPEETLEEKVARLEQEKADVEAKNKKLYARLKETKEEKPEPKEEPKAPSKSNKLTPMDIIALSKADIPEEDIQEVLDYAEYKKIPVSEALKSPVVRATLSEKKEERASAQAANVRTTARGTQKVTPDKLLSDMKSGKVPDNDDDMQRLVKARLGLK